MRPCDDLHVAPLLMGDVAANSVVAADTPPSTAACCGRGDVGRLPTCRGHSIRASAPASCCVHSRRPASHARPLRSSLPHPIPGRGSSLSAMAVEEAPGCLVGAPDAARGRRLRAAPSLTWARRRCHGAEAPARSASRRLGVVVLSELRAASMLAALRRVDPRLLAHLPLPPRPEQQGQVRTLAMVPPGAGAAAAAEAAEASPRAAPRWVSRCGRPKPLSHVLLCELGGARLPRLGVETCDPHNPRARCQHLLPHCQSARAAPPSALAGGRRQGQQHALLRRRARRRLRRCTARVTCDLLWLGNQFAARDPCEAFGG